MKPQQELYKIIAQLTVELNATQKLLHVVASGSKFNDGDEAYEALESFRFSEWNKIEGVNQGFSAFASGGSTIDFFRDINIE